jgi:hypothetical protein
MGSSRTGVDYRLFLSDEVCEYMISKSEEELLNIAVQQAVQAHGHRDTPALREELRSMLCEERKRRKCLRIPPRLEVMKLDAVCYSESKPDERSAGFRLDGHAYLVEETLDSLVRPREVDTVISD